MNPPRIFASIGHTTAQPNIRLCSSPIQPWAKHNKVAPMPVKAAPTTNPSSGENQAITPTAKIMRTIAGPPINNSCRHNAYRPCLDRQNGQIFAAPLIFSAQKGQILVCSFSAINFSRFLPRLQRWRVKAGAGGGSFGIKYQSAKYNNTPGNAALKMRSQNPNYAQRDDDHPKCFASPPQTPAIRRSFM